MTDLLPCLDINVAVCELIEEFGEFGSNLFEDSAHSAKHRSDDIEKRPEHRGRDILDALPYPAESGLDVLPNLDDVVAELIDIDSRFFEHSTKQRVIALHEVDEVLHQQGHDDKASNQLELAYADALDDFIDKAELRISVL